LCGSNGCTKPSTTRILFTIGFSASFCKECASRLITEEMGIEDRNAEDKEKILNKLRESNINAPVESIEKFKGQVGENTK
jgi:hypothetical protein